MISKSQLYLMEAIKASLFNLKPEFSFDIEWSEVLSEAKAHTVLGLVSHVLPIRNEASEQCKAMYMRIMFEQDRIIKLLDSAFIPFVILKGSAAAIYYPKPYLRTMGDIDILVPQSSFIDALKLLEVNGYVYDHGKEDDEHDSEGIRELAYIKNGVFVEIHQRFSSADVYFDDILFNALSRREYYQINGYRFPVFPQTENGLVLLGHIHQHLKSNSLGLRQIIDWEMFVHSQANNELWSQKFLPLIENKGLLVLAAYITRMCYRYLGLPKDVDYGIAVDDSLVDDLLEIVLNDGNFGRRLSENKDPDEMRMMSASYGIKKHGFWGYFISVGLKTSEFCKKHQTNKVIAFICGFFRQFFMGLRAIILKNKVRINLNEGNMKYELDTKRPELYKKLGVISEKE